MNNRNSFKVVLAITFCVCGHVCGAGYSISTFPTNTFLGPTGPVAIPSAVQQFTQVSPKGYISGVNDLGQWALSSDAPGSNWYVYVYLPTGDYGLPAGINEINSNTGSSWATAINDAGQVVGSDGDNWRLWNIGGTTSTLGTQTGLAGVANGVNNSGQTIVQDSISSSSIHIYVWSPVAENGYAQGLTDLVPAGSNISGDPLGIAINAYGDALYRATITSTSTTFQAYLNVGINHGLTRGTVALSGANWSMYQPVGLNDLDEAVGMATFTTSNSSYNDPALWTPTNGGIDLNSLLPANSGWILKTVTGIDQLGDIEGTGLYNGISTPYLLSVPEPMVGILVWSVLMPACWPIRSAKPKSRDFQPK